MEKFNHVHFSPDDSFENDNPEANEDDEIKLPDVLPILPLRGLVAYPQTAVPLTVGQPRSVALIDATMSKDRLIGLFTSRKPELEMPGPDDIHPIGVLAYIQRIFRAPDGTIRILVQCQARIHIDEYVSQEPFLTARVRFDKETVEVNLETEALMRTITDQFSRLADLLPNIPSELVNSALNTTDPLQLVYAISTYVRMDLDKSQDILEENSAEGKLRILSDVMAKELDVLELGRKIQSEAQSEMEKSQRDYYLREQLKAIQRELGESDDQVVEVEEFREKVEGAGMPEEAYKEAKRELDRLSRLPISSAEYGVIRTYLDWMVSLPWAKRTDDQLDINNARKVLDEDHYGLKDIKERILEFLAVRKIKKEREKELSDVPQDYLRKDRLGAILCFVGPPGVGKTSLGASIARAMGRKFIRMSLGGIRDESEIRGFRRTYIGALPGRIVQTIRRVETRNPIIMLDEIDKLGRDFRGDPAAALLEVLDPEQNSEFRDHYLDVAFDLSEVLFITTANDIDTIPGPLLDRMEIIKLSGYTELEKLAIASQYLVKRQIRENGLRPEEIEFTDEALLEIVREYTREAGVRTLEREIARVARKVVTKIAAGDTEKAVITKELAREYLGNPKYGYRTEIEERTDLPGVATGLAWTPVGGDVLFIEATRMTGSKGFQITGRLGDVMQESAKLALSYIRAKAGDLNIDADFYANNDIHIHVPEGAVPKDGPSAGVTLTVALVSLLTNRPTKRNVAMTGEITLQGKILPVGGIKDKVLAAHRLGVDTVILPRKNENDLDDVPEEVRKALTFILVDDLDTALNAALVPTAPIAPIIPTTPPTPKQEIQPPTH